jgi:hypothetical protein
MCLGAGVGVKSADYCESFNEYGWHNCWTISKKQHASIMNHKINFKILAPLLLLSSLGLNSCEPPLCAYCYDTRPILRVFDDRDIEICAEDAYELEELVWLTEEMGYRCEYK